MSEEVFGMHRIFITRIIGVVLTAVFLCAAQHAISGETLDFVVIQPGQPGSPEEAQPVMDELAMYIGKKSGAGAAIKGTYFNRLDEALDYLNHQHPQWGIVSLGFYAEHAHRFQMIGLAGTRPGAQPKDIWRLVVTAGGCTDWKALQGKVVGNMLFEGKAAACLLFNMPADRLPFPLEGTFHPLRSLRNVVKGDAAAVVLDRVQYEAVQALPLAKQIHVIHTSRELPTSPVVWFGETDVNAKTLTEILLAMKGDGDAQTLLTLLQTDGFGPADPDLGRYRLGQNRTVCFP
jgi:hypothetical protein